MILQDAPFFVFRVILITYYRLISSMNIFCTMKNTLVIALQVQYICSHKFGHKYCKYTVHNPSTMKNTLVIALQVKYICKYCTNIFAYIAQIYLQILLKYIANIDQLYLQPIASIKMISPQFYRLIVVQIEAAASAEAEKEKERKARKGAGKGKSGGGKIGTGGQNCTAAFFNRIFFTVTFNFHF